jgi:ankyrin repeat protein
LNTACYRCYDQDEDEAVDARIFCVKALAEAGADINFVKPGSKLTALHWAAFNDDKVVVQFLLNSGA